MGNEFEEIEEELKLAPVAPPVRKVAMIAPQSASTLQQDSPATPAMKVAVDPTKLMYRKRLAPEPVKQPPAFSPARDGVLPGILIAAGLALCVVAGRYQGDGQWFPIHAVIGPVALDILTGLALVIGAVFAASAMGGVAFHEPVPLIIYKLAAIALAPGAVGQIAGAYIGGYNGDIARVFVSLGCYIALFVLLFHLAMSDRVVCVTLIFIIRAAVTYLIFRFQGAKQGSAI